MLRFHTRQPYRLEQIFRRRNRQCFGLPCCKNKKYNSYSFPKGKNREEALCEIVPYFDYPKFSTIEKHETEILEKLFPGKYEFTEERDSFDYVYSREKLATLGGKKYHGKRNHIAYFERTFNWSFEELNRSNIDDCIAMNEKWYTLNVEKDREGIEDEREVLRLNFAHFEEIGGIGGVLRIDGEVVAFTFGERLNDNTFDTHFEKAYSDIRSVSDDKSAFRKDSAFGL